MKSQFAGIILFSLILVFVVSFGHINPAVSFDLTMPLGPENLMMMTSEYYVDVTTGDDDSGNGSVLNPWASIGKAMDELDSTSGYTLYIGAGTYNENDTIEVLSSGTSGNPPVYNQIIGDRDANKIGAGGDIIVNATGNNYGIDTHGESYIYIYGLNIISSNQHGVYVSGNSDNVILDTLSITNIGQTAGDYAGVYVNGSGGSYPDEIQINNSTISGDEYGVFVGSGSNAGSIYNNTIELTSGSNAVQITSCTGDWYLTNNRISVTSGTNGVYLDSVTKPVIFNNFIVGSFTNSVLYDKDSTNFYMNYNSLSNLSSATGVKGYFADRTSSKPAKSFHNNIIALATAADSYVIYISDTNDWWVPSTNTDISNNLYYNGANLGYYEGNCSDLGSWQSILNTAASSSDYDANSNGTDDPLFTSSSDLSLQDISPCFAAGTPISNITTDIEEDERNETNPCIGADELTSLTISSGKSKTITWSQGGLEEINITGTLTIEGPSTPNTEIEMDFGSINISGNGNLVLTDNVLLKCDEINMTNDGRMHLGDLGTEVRANDITVGADAKIIADGEGYANGGGEGAGGNSGSYGGGGGAYGGDGATGGTGESGGTGGQASSYTTDYLCYYPYLDAGSGGGNGNNSIGGYGGGIIKLEVFNTLDVDGYIQANGNNGSNGISAAGETGAGGGAGGGIYIYVKNLTGSGYITANGGNGGNGYNDDNGGGAGGGGRIAIYYKTEQFTASNIQVNAGSNGLDCGGSADSGSKEFLELPDFSWSYNTDSAAVSGTYGNETVNLVDLSLVTQYQVTYLQFNDSLSRNFELYYGSTNDITYASSPIGSDNWTHSFNENLDVSAVGSGRIKYMMYCGVTVVYEETSANVFTALPFYGDMPVIATGGAVPYLMTYKNGNVKTFDNYGKWTSYADPMGNEMTLTYSGNNLTQITFPDERKIVITYGIAPQISDVTCYDNSTNVIQSEVCFTYIGYNLDSFGDWVFAYNGGKLYQQKHKYNSTPSYYTTTFTVDGTTGECTAINDSAPTSKTMSFTQDKIHHTTTVTDRKSKNWIYECDQLMNLVTKSTDPDTYFTTYEYDTKRRLTRFTPPQDSDFTAMNSYTDYTYDSNGNVLTQVVTKTTDPSNSYIRSEYTYDSYNNMTTSSGPVAYSGDPGVLAANLLKTKVTYSYTYNEGAGLGLIESEDTSVTGTNTAFESELEIGDTITVNYETRTVISISDDYNLTINLAFSENINPATSYTINYGYAQYRKVKEVSKKINVSTDFVTHFNYDTNGRITQITSNYGDTDQRIKQIEYYPSTTYGNNAIKGFIENLIVYNGGGTNDIVTNCNYYGNGSLREVTSPTGLITQYVRNSKGQVTQLCKDPVAGGLQVGKEFEYNLAGLIVSTKTGSFSSWTLGGTCAFNTSDDYTETTYYYDSYARRIASCDRLSHGYVNDLDEEGYTTRTRSGFVNTSRTPVITTIDKAYSEMLYEYNDNGSLNKASKLLSGTDYAEIVYDYYPDGSTKSITGPKYDSSHDMESKYEYDYVGRTTKSYRKIDETPTFVDKESTYDVFGRLQHAYDENDKETQYVYNEYSSRLTDVIVDPSGEYLKTSYDYNDFGQTTKITYASHSVVNGEQIYRFYEYDDLGRMDQTYIGEASGDNWSTGVSRMQFYYDSAGRPYKKTTCDIVDGTDSSVEYIFDALNRTEAVCLDTGVGGLQEGSKYYYDSVGRIEQVDNVVFSAFNSSSSSYSVGATLRRISRVYDYAGRVEESILNPIGAGATRLQDITTFYKYDELSNVVKVIDPEQWLNSGRQETGAKHTAYTYDNASRLTGMSVYADLEGSGSGNYQLRKYDYNENGSVSSYYYTQEYDADPSWIEVGYGYYPTGWLKTVDSPGFEYTYQYFNTGVLQKIQSGITSPTDLFEKIYDDAWRLTETKTTGTTDKKFTYNDRSQVTHIKDSGDNTRYQIDYDDYGRIEATYDSTNGVFSSSPLLIEYEYYKSGLRKELKTSKYSIKYLYDKASRLSEVQLDEDETYLTLAEYNYNGLGQRTSLTRYNTDTSSIALYTEYEYLDQIGWLQEVVNMDNPTSRNILSYYKYFSSTEGDKNDLTGNRLYMEYGEYDYVDYVYDDLYRLFSETRKLDNVQTNKYEFTYDAAGNRKTQSRFTEDTPTPVWENYFEYTYNTANQLTLEKRYTYNDGPQDKETQYDYNSLGNLIEKNIDITLGDLNYTDEQWDYGYDAYNRLTSVDESVSSKEIDYTYNMLGNRVMKVDGADTIKMLYDAYDCVIDYDGSDTELRHYITPMRNENLLVYNYDSNDASIGNYYYAHDGSGSVRQIFNTSQQAENNYNYEYFGSSYSFGEEPEYGLYNRFSFIGGEVDIETQTELSESLYHFNSGTYNPSNGLSFCWGYSYPPFTDKYPNFDDITEKQKRSMKGTTLDLGPDIDWPEIDFGSDESQPNPGEGNNGGSQNDGRQNGGKQNRGIYYPSNGLSYCWGYSYPPAKGKHRKSGKITDKQKKSMKGTTLDPGPEIDWPEIDLGSDENESSPGEQQDDGSQNDEKQNEEKQSNGSKSSGPQKQSNNERSTVRVNPFGFIDDGISYGVVPFWDYPELELPPDYQSWDPDVLEEWIRRRKLEIDAARGKRVGPIVAPDNNPWRTWGYSVNPLKPLSGGINFKHFNPYEGSGGGGGGMPFGSREQGDTWNVNPFRSLGGIQYANASPEEMYGDLGGGGGGIGLGRLPHEKNN